MSAYVVSKSTTDASQRVNDLSGSEGAFSIGNDLLLSEGASFTQVQTDQGAVEASFGFASEFGGEALGFGRDIFTQASETTGKALETVANVASNQQQFAGQVTDKVAGLAEAFQSDGASRDRKMVMYLGIGGFALAAVVIVAVNWKGGK